MILYIPTHKLHVGNQSYINVGHWSHKNSENEDVKYSFNTACTRLKTAKKHFTLPLSPKTTVSTKDIPIGQP